jgi:hypothetical protein
LWKISLMCLGSVRATSRFRSFVRTKIFLIIVWRGSRLARAKAYYSCSTAPSTSTLKTMTWTNYQLYSAVVAVIAIITNSESAFLV